MNPAPQPPAEPHAGNEAGQGDAVHSTGRRAPSARKNAAGRPAPEHELSPEAKASILRMAIESAGAAVAELEKPIFIALRSAAYRRDLTQYVVVCDDTSGRIPSRIVWRALKEIRRHAATPGALCVAFLPGGWGQGRFTQLADRALHRAAPALGRAVGDGRALIVTDATFTGGTVMRMAKGLTAHGIPCDILVPFASYSLAPPEGCRLFVGDWSGHRPRVDGAHDLSGVHKWPRTYALRSQHVVPYAREARRFADAAGSRIAAALIERGLVTPAPGFVREMSDGPM